jgi:hypothetical protein
MKKLLIIPMLFMCNMVIGQVTSEIIGNPKKIERSFLVAQYDFPTPMNWADATDACAALGDGWRLPSKDELNILYQNKNDIGNFDIILYLSSTEFDNNGAWRQDFYDGGQNDFLKGDKIYVRAVRTF